MCWGPLNIINWSEEVTIMMLTRSGTVMEDNIRVVARWWPLPDGSWLSLTEKYLQVPPPQLQGTRGRGWECSQLPRDPERQRGVAVDDGQDRKGQRRNEGKEIYFWQDSQTNSDPVTGVWCNSKEHCERWKSVRLFYTLKFIQSPL